MSAGHAITWLYIKILYTGQIHTGVFLIHRSSWDMVDDLSDLNHPLKICSSFSWQLIATYVTNGHQWNLSRIIQSPTGLMQMSTGWAKYWKQKKTKKAMTCFHIENWDPVCYIRMRRMLMLDISAFWEAFQSLSKSQQTFMTSSNKCAHAVESLTQKLLHYIPLFFCGSSAFLGHISANASAAQAGRTRSSSIRLSIAKTEGIIR